MICILVKMFQIAQYLFSKGLDEILNHANLYLDQNGHILFNFIFIFQPREFQNCKISISYLKANNCDEFLVLIKLYVKGKIYA